MCIFCPYRRHRRATRELMAIFGWKTANQACVYTRKARLRRLAGDAMHMIALDENESTECPTAPARRAKST